MVATETVVTETMTVTVSVATVTVTAVTVTETVMSESVVTETMVAESVVAVVVTVTGLGSGEDGCNHGNNHEEGDLQQVGVVIIYNIDQLLTSNKFR